MAARPQRSNLALDDVRVSGKAQIVVAADLDVARPRRAALQRMLALPKLYFAPDVVIIRPSTDEIWVARGLYLANLGSVIRNRTICNSKLHFNPHLVKES